MFLLSGFMLFISIACFAGSESTCQNRCGDHKSSNFTCQCNPQCAQYGDCCDDFQSQCNLTCAGMCGLRYNRTRSCQCNDDCTKHDNCCDDYRNKCSSYLSECKSVDQVVQQMWDNDVNRMGQGEITINYQHQVADRERVDKADEKLFSGVNDSKLADVATYRTFIATLNNFRHEKGVAENMTLDETQEEAEFLDAVLDTLVMQALEEFLVCRREVNNRTDLRQKLQTMWFDLYPRSGRSSVPDTSGFEHLMVGEYKSTSVVNGFHNWVAFYESEKSGRLDYYGYVTRNTITQNSALVGAAFKWDGRVKDLGSFFAGVSPEFDIGLYSLCFILYPGNSCQFVIESKPFVIQSYNKEGHIATAFASATWQDPVGLTNPSVTSGSGYDVSSTSNPNSSSRLIAFSHPLYMALVCFFVTELLFS